MLVLLGCAAIIYAYRFSYAWIDFYSYIASPDAPQGLGPQKFMSVEDSIPTDGSELTYEFYQFWFYYTFGPMKISNIGDIMMLVACALSQSWSCVAFVALPIIPSLGVEYGVMTSQPYLDMPYFDWDLVVAYFQDANSERVSKNDANAASGAWKSE